MKPITSANPEGRALLALRAGPMTPTEVGARIGCSLPGWLIKVGYVVLDDSYYRLTEAGRAACPYRNPLAAPGVVQPYTFKPETDMSRGNCITRQQVLATIVEAGAAGITRMQLVERFKCAEANIDMHISALNRQLPPVIFKPERGRVCAIEHAANVPAPKVIENATVKALHATREAVLDWLGKAPAEVMATPWSVAHGIGCTEDSTRAVLAGLYAGLKVDRQKLGDEWAYFIGAPKMETQSEPVTEPVVRVEPAAEPTMPPPAEVLPVEEIVLPGGELVMPSVKDIDELAKMLAPIAPTVVEDVMLDDPDGVEFAIFSSGGLDIYCAETTVTLNKGVLNKLRRFLGLFQEAV